MKNLIICLCLIGSVLYAKQFDNKELVLCCGAGLMKPMNEIVKNFEQQSGAKVNLSYGGSGEIFLALGTRGCDVFVPGAANYTKNAIDRGYVDSETVHSITKHIPVIVTQKGNPKNIKTLSDFAKDGVKVAIGDPRSVPIGKVAYKMFEKAHIKEAVVKNVVTEVGTVNQLLVYMAMNQADAAVIWEDMVSWAKEKGKLEIIEIPKEQNIIKTIPNGVGSMSKDKELANAFNMFMINEDSNKIWQKWGFEL